MARTKFRPLVLLAVPGVISAALMGCASGDESESASSGGSGNAAATGGSSGAGGSAAGAGGSSTGGTGGSTGGTGGSTGGTGGSTGGSAGAAAAGGTAGAATGGAAGSSGAGGTGAAGGSAGAGGAAGTAGAAGAAAGGTGGGTGGSGGGTGGTSGNPEVCDGLDNDGDGQIDNGNPGGGQACTVTNAAGVCAEGQTQCIQARIVCQSVAQPSPEICDGRDNNCNGTADEGNPGGNQPCSTGSPGLCAAGTSRCDAGSIVCQPNFSPTNEVCNGADDNCDGTVDEGTSGATCTNNNAQGQCRPGTYQCNGQLECVSNLTPSVELCDGLDNDCDGTIDNGNPGGGLPCDTGQQGVCATGTTSCVSGQPQCIQTTPSSAEICDNLDNDCNGTIDDGDPALICARTCPAPYPDFNNSTYHVGNTVCSAGVCSVTCAGDFLNTNANICDGCEAATCSSSPSSGADCNSPASLSAAGTSSLSGQLVTQGESRYIQVSFSTPVPGQPSTPTISLTGGAGDYRMDILTSCSGSPVTCPSGGDGNDRLTWSMNFNANLSSCNPCGGSVQNCCTNQASLPGLILIKITRETAVDLSNRCNPFSISVSQ